MAGRREQDQQQYVWGAEEFEEDDEEGEIEFQYVRDQFGSVVDI